LDELEAFGTFVVEKVDFSGEDMGRLWLAWKDERGGVGDTIFRHRDGKKAVEEEVPRGQRPLVAVRIGL
jgi:hypothetical protein